MSLYFSYFGLPGLPKLIDPATGPAVPAAAPIVGADAGTLVSLRSSLFATVGSRVQKPAATDQQRLDALLAQQAQAEADAAAAAAYEQGLAPSSSVPLPLILGLLGVLALGGVGYTVYRRRKSKSKNTAGYRRKGRNKKRRR